MSYDTSDFFLRRFLRLMLDTKLADAHQCFSRSAFFSLPLSTSLRHIPWRSTISVSAFNVWYLCSGSVLRFDGTVLSQEIVMKMLEIGMLFILSTSCQHAMTQQNFFDALSRWLHSLAGRLRSCTRSLDGITMEVALVKSMHLLKHRKPFGLFKRSELLNLASTTLFSRGRTSS